MDNDEFEKETGRIVEEHRRQIKQEKRRQNIYYLKKFFWRSFPLLLFIFWYFSENREFITGRYIMIFFVGVGCGKFWGNVNWLMNVPKKSFIDLGGKYYIYHEVKKEDIPFE